MKSEKSGYQNITKDKTAVIYGILWQCMIIAVFFAVFFLTAVSSSLFQCWDKGFKDAAVSGAVISCIILIVFFCGWLFLFIRQGYYKSDYDIVGMGTILVLSYIIRVGMPGTLQIDEGLYCYTDLNELAHHPELMLSDFFASGKLAGRAAYGYNFFALMGEFMLPGTGSGFQWVQLYMGVGAACCFYGIFRKLFPAVRKIILMGAGLVVSLQPMFLGLSTLCGLEYGIVVFFIYAFYCCLYKRYILMSFWLVLLAATKGTGAIMSLCFISSFFTANLLKYAAAGLHESYSKDSCKMNPRLAGTCIVTLTAIAAFAGIVWKICSANGIGLNFRHLQLKLAQLYALNFSWIWALIVVIGMVMIIFNRTVRRTYRMDFVPVFMLTAAYLVHTAYLVFYTNAVLPRYNMLSDILLCIIGVILLIKMFERRRAILSVLGILGVLMFGEAFMTIDPISSSVFTTIESDTFPLVQTSSFKSECVYSEEAPGDYCFYNYQYTLIYSAKDDILQRFNLTGGCEEMEAQREEADSKSRWNY